LLSFSIFIQADDCTSYSPCSSCTKSLSCVWCNDNSQCVNGTIVGPNQSCKDWRWMQCTVSGVWILLGFIAAGIVGVVIFMVCLWCVCCCRGKRRRNISMQDSYDIVKMREEERLVDKDTRTPVTDKHREKMAEKYGVGRRGSDNL